MSSYEKRILRNVVYRDAVSFLVSARARQLNDQRSKGSTKKRQGVSQCPVNEMTVDVEYYCQVSASKGFIPGAGWKNLEGRIEGKSEGNMGQILDSFSSKVIKATFFALAWIAQRYSINKTNLWAHDILRKIGLRCSSSIAPVKYAFRGIAEY